MSIPTMLFEVRTARKRGGPRPKGSGQWITGTVGKNSKSERGRVSLRVALGISQQVFGGGKGGF